MLSTAAFIIGMIILGLCLVAAAFMLSGAINGAAAALKESSPQSMQQPTLTFLTEYDAADYLGISLNELDYIRSEGMLDGSFVAVTSLEQTGEDYYVDFEDGVEVRKSRPIMSNVTRFLFNRQLLDEKMMEAIKSGRNINPLRTKQDKKQNTKHSKHHDEKKSSSKNASRKNSDSDDITVGGKSEERRQEREPVKFSGPKKASPAGPPKPMGPISDDDSDADDVIDIMSRINSVKQGRTKRPEISRQNVDEDED